MAGLWQSAYIYPRVRVRDCNEDGGHRGVCKWIRLHIFPVTVLCFVVWHDRQSWRLRSLETQISELEV